MYLNKAACAVRKACGSGNGDGPFEHVKIDGEYATATDGTVAVRISLPTFEDPHPCKEDATEEAQVLHKAEIKIIENMLPGGDEKNPTSAALITEGGALRIKGDNILELNVQTTQGKLPFDNIDFPDVSSLLPEETPKGASITFSVKKLFKVLQSAKMAGVEKLDFTFAGSTKPTFLVGTNGETQSFLGAIMPSNGTDE